MKTKKEKKYRNMLVGGTMLTLMVFGVALAMILANTPIGIEKPMEERVWMPLAQGNPDTNVGGFLYFGTYPHADDPGSTYNVNLSSGTFFEYTTDIGASVALTGETPHSTRFDFVMQFGVNNSQAYNIAESQWEDDWVRANISVIFAAMTGQNLDNESMTLIRVATKGTEYAWYHAYVNNEGDGFLLTHDESFTVSSLKADFFA